MNHSQYSPKIMALSHYLCPLLIHDWWTTYLQTDLMASLRTKLKNYFQSFALFVNPCFVNQPVNLSK